MEGRTGSIGIGEGKEDSSAVSIVLATSKSREEGLELGSRERIGVPPVSALEVPIATKVGVATGVLLEGKKVARNLNDKGVCQGEAMDTKGKLCRLAGLGVGEDVYD